MKLDEGFMFYPVHVNTTLGLTSAALENACELLQNCLADVKAVTSELNVKGELWKITCLKMSSVTSTPLRFPECLFVGPKTQRSST